MDMIENIIQRIIDNKLHIPILVIYGGSYITWYNQYKENKKRELQATEDAIEKLLLHSEK